MDKVFDKRDDLVFEGAPEQVRDWLVRNPAYWMGSTTRLCVIRIGDTSTIVSAQEYLGMETENKPKNEIDLSPFVEQYYEMNPETEDVVRGANLRNGMVVLVENPHDRVGLDHVKNEIGRQTSKARMMNRWCTVADLQHHEETTLSFIGVYEDNTKRLRENLIGDAWLVKLDSLPSVMDEIEQKWNCEKGTSTTP